ncbi:Maff2 family mobile element protein [Mediterraneibacter faecis]|uniref:Maff2 family mobile element protein n=1 Tax=Mediterraneibacter faecis TaxID=592978 RepID=UPI003F88625E
MKSLRIRCQLFLYHTTTLKTLVVAIGAGLGVWGVVNLLEGYGNDNRATRS